MYYNTNHDEYSSILCIHTGMQVELNIERKELKNTIEK